ncbi:unnamed protein product [Penicillium olsonii]|nr:unnamed protein product [Penicillium olsonii]
MIMQTRTSIQNPPSITTVSRRISRNHSPTVRRGPGRPPKTPQASRYLLEGSPEADDNVNQDIYPKPPKHYNSFWKNLEKQIIIFILQPLNANQDVYPKPLPYISKNQRNQKLYLIAHIIKLTKSILKSHQELFPLSLNTTLTHLHS